MNAKIIRINDEEFPESILDAPKMKFLRPKKKPNFVLLLEEEVSSVGNKEKIFYENCKKCTEKKKVDFPKYEKRKILEYMKKMSSITAQDSNSHSRSDSGEFIRNKQEEKIILVPDIKL